MRKSLFGATLVAGVLVGYALRPAPAVAQGQNFMPFSLGEVVRLNVTDFPAGLTTITCKLSSIGTDFISCAGDGQLRPRAVNIRYVREITPVPDR